MVVDLTGLRYLSSCGVAPLLDAAALATRRGTVLKVRASAGSVSLRILELAGLADKATGP